MADVPFQISQKKPFFRLLVHFLDMMKRKFKLKTKKNFLLLHSQMDEDDDEDGLKFLLNRINNTKEPCRMSGLYFI